MARRSKPGNPEFARDYDKWLRAEGLAYKKPPPPRAVKGRKPLPGQIDLFDMDANEDTTAPEDEKR